MVVLDPPVTIATVVPDSKPLFNQVSRYPQYHALRAPALLLVRDRLLQFKLFDVRGGMSSSWCSFYSCKVRLARFMWMICNERLDPLLVFAWLVLRLPKPNNQGLDIDLDVLKLDSRESATPSLREAEKSAEPEPVEHGEQVCHSPRVVMHSSIIRGYQS